MKRLEKQGRQGDVWLTRIEALPARLSNVKKVKVKAEGGRLILAKGELSGHDHAIDEEKGQLFTLDGDPATMLLEITSDTPLIHPEHEDIELPEGMYLVSRQVESKGASRSTREIYD